jgi:cysteine desulfurase/selenocysteine lyase
MDRFGIAATVRASLAFYNTRAEIDALAAALMKIAGTRQARPRTEQQPIVYPAASAKSVRAAADALADEFDFLGDRDAKNEYVLDMAKNLPHLFDLLEKVTTRVPGCMSQVYLVGRRRPGQPNAGAAGVNGNSGGVFEFVADADAEIVRGLIAILQRLYSGQHAKDVLEFDIEGFFQRIGLDQFITSQRRNGLAGMVARIRELAGEGTHAAAST